MANKDIRWIQRFNNYRKALARLGEAVALAGERELSDLEQQGLIQAFEFTCDMGWKTLQDFVIHHGYEGEREKPVQIIIDAAQKGIIDEKNWRGLYQARCKTSHSYDEAVADDIAENILSTYHGLFIQLETRLRVEQIGEEKNLFNQDDSK